MLWKSETILIDGDAYYAGLTEEWARAQRTIDFEVYIFDNDPIGLEIAAALQAAAARGVQVRLMVDGIGASGWWQTRGVELEKAGVQVRVFHPIVSTELWRRLMIDLNLIDPGRKPKRSLFIRRLNRRNHRKVSIIDGRVAFVGSVNVSQTHSLKTVGSNVWRDTSVRLEGHAVADLTFAFDHAWRRSQGVSQPTRPKMRFFFRRRSKITESPVGLNFTRKIRRHYRLKFIRRIESAQKRIWVANAYLAPPSNILRRLVHAAKRGVDVRVLVPVRSDVWFMPLISRAYYRPLLRGGVRLYEYQPRFFHAKSLLIDDTLIIGTSNLNRRSFLHDLEVDVLVDNPDSINAMVAQYEKDFEQSEEVKTSGGFFISRIGQVLNYFFRYWV